MAIDIGESIERSRATLQAKLDEANNNVATLAAQLTAAQTRAATIAGDLDNLIRVKTMHDATPELFIVKE